MFLNLLYDFGKFLFSHLNIKFNIPIAYVFSIVRDQYHKLN